MAFRLSSRLLSAAVVKKTTGITGLDVVPNAREVLVKLYEKTLKDVQASLRLIDTNRMGSYVTPESFTTGAYLRQLVGYCPDTDGLADSLLLALEAATRVV